MIDETAIERVGADPNAPCRDASICSTDRPPMPRPC